MCDYSLYEFPNRLAREGEELVTYKFPTGSIGLVSPVELENARSKESLLDKRSSSRLWGAVTNHFELARCVIDRPSACAICVPPGASLELSDIPAEMQQDLGVGSVAVGEFIETGFDAYRHRDAIRFANGCVLVLQRLREGQRVRVLSLVPTEGFGGEHQSALSALTC